MDFGATCGSCGFSIWQVTCCCVRDIMVFEDDKDSLNGLVEISTPAFGESVSEAIVGTWYFSAGDTVNEDQVLCELETDKVALEVRSPGNGILDNVSCKTGDTVKQGDILAYLKTAENAGDSTGSSSSKPQGTSKNNIDAQTESEVKAEDSREIASPAARKIAHQHGVDLNKVEGSGSGGRVMKPDVKDSIGIAPASTPAFAPAHSNVQGNLSGSTGGDLGGDNSKRVPMSSLRKTIARRLKEAQNTAAILTTYNEIDMTEVMRLRSAYKDDFLNTHGAKLGFMSFFVRASVRALKEFPELNSEIDGNDIIYKYNYHVGVAVGTPNGLIVPVIKNAGDLNFADIEKKVLDMGDKARQGKISIDDLKGGTFTISNGGIYGSLMSTPIINPPQSGILGMHKIQERPIVENGNIVVKPMMYVALSYDHRIIDGKGAVSFLVRIKEFVEDPVRFLFGL